MYYINGTSMTNSQVKSMFKSVGLNIDSPETFFVGQGRITKIVSFKPEDLRVMLFEAANIAYFHEVADKSERLMEKSIITQEQNEERIERSLGPTLRRIEKQQVILNEYNQLVKEKEHKETIIDQVKLVENNRKIDFAQSEIGFINSTIESLKSKISMLNKQKKEEMRRANELGIDNQSQEIHSPELIEAKLTLQSLEESISDLMNRERGARDTLDINCSKIDILKAELEQTKESLNKKAAEKTLQEQQIDRIAARIDSLKEEKGRAKQNLESLALKVTSGGGKSEYLRHLEGRELILKEKVARIQSKLEYKTQQILKGKAKILEIEQNRNSIIDNKEQLIAQEYALKQEIEGLRQIVKYLLISGKRTLSIETFKFEGS